MEFSEGYEKAVLSSRCPVKRDGKGPEMPKQELLIMNKTFSVKRGVQADNVIWEFESLVGRVKNRSEKAGSSRHNVLTP